MLETCNLSFGIAVSLPCQPSDVLMLQLIKLLAWQPEIERDSEEGSNFVVMVSLIPSVDRLKQKPNGGVKVSLKGLGDL